MIVTHTEYLLEPRKFSNLWGLLPRKRIPKTPNYAKILEAVGKQFTNPTYPKPSYPNVKPASWKTEVDEIRRNETSHYEQTSERENFATSYLVAAATNSTLAGYLAGGSYLGASLGDASVPDTPSSTPTCDTTSSNADYSSSCDASSYSSGCDTSSSYDSSSSCGSSDW